MKYLAAILALTLPGCARTWVNYPPVTVVGKDGTTRSVASRAFEMNGSDSLGATEIEVTRDGVRFASAGGIDNSTSTKAGYDFGKHGITAGATVATAGFAAASYMAAQKAATATSMAATKAGTATSIAATRAGVATEAIKAGIVPIR